MQYLLFNGVDVGPGERLFALYLNDEGRKVLFLNTLFTVEQKDCEKFGLVIQTILFHF